METKTNVYEEELIEALAEAFAIATEFLDAETIVRCIKAALELESKHYEEMSGKYTLIKNCII